MNWLGAGLLGYSTHMTCAPDATLLAHLAAALGPRGYSTDPDMMAPWLRDWRGRREGRAAALLSPATTDEVQLIVRAAAAARVALVPQGGNTSMVAGATPGADGGALLLSLRRMNRVRSTSAADNMLVAEAGVVLDQVHAAAAAIDRRFPLSLAAKGSATVGGLVSSNAGGTQVLRFGPMRALVLGLEAVLPDGTVFSGLSALRKDNRGYDLRHLLIGAEGTLGVVTAASLRLVPGIGARAVAWAGMPTPEAALALLRSLEARLGEAVESYEILPAAGLALVLQHIPGTRTPLADDHPWHVLIEAVALPGAPAPDEALGSALATCLANGLIADAVVAANEQQANAFWRLRETMSEAERQDGMAAKHDVSVPVSRMPALLIEGTGLVEARFPGTRVLAFGHLGDGNVHFNVRAPLGVDDRRWLAAEGATVSAFVHDLVTARDGSLSAEHGIGDLKLADFARLAGPARLGAMRAIKAALDPLGIMNPGKLVPPVAPVGASQ